MAYASWRRFKELLALDHGAANALFLRRRDRALTPPGKDVFDGYFASGDYDRLWKADERHHHRLLAAMLAARRPGARLLDIGCGDGALYDALRPLGFAPYCGLDLSEVGVERARTRFNEDVAAGRAAFIVGDARALEAGGERFDVVVMSECLEYLGDPAAVIARCRSLLEPEGLIGVTIWLGQPRIRVWRQAKAEARVLDEALISTPRGGAWLVAVLDPAQRG
jgi:2-polyprenyl-3-methyl-5-hydroxy-6-metoxy-1,4-benzoquinol methylase